MKNIKKLLLILLFNPAIAFAGFTTEAGKLDFTAEYVMAKTNQSKNNNEIEIDNELGLGNNFSIGVKLFYSTYKYFNDIVQDDDRSKYTNFNLYQKSNFQINDTNDIGMRNRLQVNKNDGENSYPVYDLRLVYLNSSSYGFYDSFRFDVGYARVFDETKADYFVNEIHLNFSLTEKIGFHTRVETAFLIASNNLVDEIGADLVNPRGGNLLKAKPLEIVLFAGPEYQLSNNFGTIYLHGRMQIGGRDKVYDRGLIFGYTKTLF